MKKDNLRKLRYIVSISFVSEMIGIISLYLNSTQSIRIGKINILSFLFMLFSLISIVLLLLFIKKVNKKDKNKKLFYILLVSFFIEIVIIVLNCLPNTQNLTPYFQVICDILKAIPLFCVYKQNIKLIKKKNFLKEKKYILIIVISYLVSKICCILIDVFNNITLKPIFSTLSILFIVIGYTIYIKFLEKILKDN